MGCSSHKVIPQVKVIRIALIGTRGSGKTALISSFLMRKFALAYVPTTTVNIGMKSYSFKDSNAIVTIEVWELYEAKGVSDSFNYIVIVLDCTKPAEELSEELLSFTSVLSLRSTPSHMSVALTKCDCLPEAHQKLLTAMQKTLPLPEDVTLYATSASDQAGIDFMFRDLAKADRAPTISRDTSVAALPSA